MAMCRSCKAPITWARSDKTGKPAPLDAAPVADGNVVIVRTLHDGDPECHVLTKADREANSYEGLQRYKSHFATCPLRVQHRRG